MRIDREPGPWAAIRDRIRAHVADDCIICLGAKVTTESADEPEAKTATAGEEQAR